LWDLTFKGQKVFRFSDADEFIAGYNKVKKYDLHNDIVIQEIITGPDYNIFVFAGYFDRDSKPLVSHTARRMRQYPPKFGTGTMFKPELNQEMLDTMVPFLQKLGYHGIVGGEMKLDPKDGKMKMLEINTRMSRWTGVVETSGVNLPYTAYCDLLGLPKPGLDYEVSDRTLIHVFRDTLSSVYYIRTGEISFGEWLDSWKGKRYYSVYAAEDSKPFWAGLMTIFFYAKNYIKKVLR
jgi:predicted ATP-grasp superfamily ATP-dependent carboligase